MKDISYYKFFLRAIGNETRAKIITSLKEESKNVTQLTEELAYEQSRVSHALKCLLDCGFVSAKRDKSSKIYSLNGEVRPLLAAMDRHIEKYKEQLARCNILKENNL